MILHLCELPSATARAAVFPREIDKPVNAHTKCEYRFNADCPNVAYIPNYIVHLGNSNDDSIDKSKPETNNLEPNVSEITIPKTSQDIFDIMISDEDINMRDYISKAMCEYESNNIYEYTIYTKNFVYNIKDGNFVTHRNIRGIQ